MTLTPVPTSTTDRGFEVYVPGVGGRDGFDKLRAFLVKHYGATVLSAADGPDARVCSLEVGGEAITLDFEDPYGNTLVSKDPSSAVLREVAADLMRRLSDPPRRQPGAVMAVDEARARMDALWLSADRDADAFRDTFIPIERLVGFYLALPAGDRVAADHVLSEWVCAEDEGKRYDAIALVQKFGIASAVGALRELSARLEASPEPGAPFQRRRAQDLIHRASTPHAIAARRAWPYDPATRMWWTSQ